MKPLGIVALLALGLILSGCGTSNASGSGNVNGNWSAALTNSDGTPAFAFTTSLMASGGNGITGLNFTFNTSSPCFVSGGTETGSFGLSGNFNGQVMGVFQFTIQSGTPNGNTLTLQGTVQNNTISGTWTLSGVTSGCTGSGNFKMNRM